MVDVDVPVVGRWSSSEVGSATTHHDRTAFFAAFGSHDDARRVAFELHRALTADRPTALTPEQPDVVPSATAAEHGWLVQAGVDPAPRGIGWLGPQFSTGPAVQVLGSLVIVDDLHMVSLDDDAPPEHPLPRAFRALGAHAVEAERDRVYARPPVFWLRCELPHDAATECAHDIADHLTLAERGLAPADPWIVPLAPEQRALRRSFRIVHDHHGALAAGTVRDEPALDAYAEIADRLRRRLDAGGAIASFADRFLEPLVPGLVDRVEPAAIEWWVERLALTCAPDRQDADADPALLGELVARHSQAIGAVPAGHEHDDRHLYGGQYAIGDDTLRLAWVIGRRASRALPALVDHLTSRGCTNLVVNVAGQDALI